MTNERLCLKWNDFQDLLQTSFVELKNDTDFTDVTLACEDQSIKAHKVVLSACSPFFKKMLKTHLHPHPLIYMKGMKSCDLTAIVDFIYLGEANIFQEQLESFLSLAEELELKGLNGSSDEKVPEYLEVPFTHTESRTDLNKMQKKTEGTISNSNVKYESNTFEGTLVRIQPKLKRTSTIDSDTIAKIETMIEKRADGYSCTNCGYIWKNTSHMKEHVEKHIEGLEYPCNLCNKIFRSSNSFRVHKSKGVHELMD